MAKQKASTMTLSEKKRAAIVAAAKKLFLEKGYSDTSMDEITQHAGVSKKTVYNHFPDKSQLFQFIILDHWNNVFDATQSIFKNGASPRKDLERYARIFLKFVYQDDTVALFRTLITESKRFPELCQKLTIEGKAPFTRELIVYLRKQTQNKKLMIKDFDLAASQFIGLLKEYHYWPMMLGFVSTSKDKTQQKVINSSVDVFLSYYTGVSMLNEGK